MEQENNILERIVYDLIWAWDHRADHIWRELDPELWVLTHNPLIILNTVSKERLQALVKDPKIHQILHDLENATIAETVNKKTWFRKRYPKAPLTSLAFFSMEFMLAESLPIYSGGLGNVAGDMLKAMNDLGVPAVGIGLLYQQGYFRQVIDEDGMQQAYYPYNSPTQLPIKPVRLPNGEWLRIELHLPAGKLWLRTWEVKIGRIRLYLLDCNDLSNYPPYRTITGELYGGNTQVRLLQEFVLGVGGAKLLQALNLSPEVYHLNEGHASFAILERARQFMEKTGSTFEVALAATKGGNVFTTHTAVPAGFDRFPPKLIDQYLGSYIRNCLNISLEEFLVLGRVNPQDKEEPFNMAYLAIRGSCGINGVSKLHGEVSRSLFSPLFPRWPESEVPVGHVTNGIHVRSWDSPASDKLWTESCGKERWMGDENEKMDKIRNISDEKIWEMREKSRELMITFGRFRLQQILKARCAPETECAIAKEQFDIKILTIGFARRFAAYKRPNMLLHDPERLVRILTNKDRPVQLAIAGKAHPADLEGQKMIQQWIQFIKRPGMSKSVVFLSDYDMAITEGLVGGVDLWINTPRRPWEACGTSGMKILVNGGLNLSVLDGWWAEGYHPDVGWAIGNTSICPPQEITARDTQEATELYDLLENTIIPEFYNRDSRGIPVQWVAKIKESMATLTLHYSTNRSLREYIENYYLPAATLFQERTENQGALAKEIVAWQRAWKERPIQIQKVSVDSNKDHHHFEAIIDLKDLHPEEIEVQLFAIGIPPIKMEATQPGHYAVSVTPERPSSQYTVRVIPHLLSALVPLENPSIVWQA
ncbi:MAG TPA: alpha-glucan family phosphorylase [Chlamydiales bacterium]|nr:alpha-glucan family phosphorylase [Chlamydiales bacterium]